MGFTDPAVIAEMDRFALEWSELGRKDAYWLVVSHTDHGPFYLDLLGDIGNETMTVHFPKENGVTVARYESRRLP